MDYKDFSRQGSSKELHFWYRARLQLIDELCSRAFEGRKESSRRILDAGSGTGTEIPLLSQYGEVTALDPESRALAEVARLGVKTIEGDLTRTELSPSSYGAVCVFDVLEHIENDREALRRIHSALMPGGALLVTVPAFQFLFSKHDEVLEHYRRYGKAELLQKLEEAGFEIRSVRYWNSILFIPAAFVRLVKKFLSFKGAEVSEAGERGFLDPVLYLILSLETRPILSKICGFFPGLSLAVYACKKHES